MNLHNQVSWKLEWKKGVLLDVKPPYHSYVFLLHALDWDLNLFS